MPEARTSYEQAHKAEYNNRTNDSWRGIRRVFAPVAVAGILALTPPGGDVIRTAQQGIGYAENAIHEVTRTHINPDQVRLGDITLHKGVDIWKGVGPQADAAIAVDMQKPDPSLAQNNVNWDEVTLNGIPLKDYQTVTGKNVYTIEIPELGTHNYDTYIVIKDAKVGNEEDDLTISAADANVSHSLDARYSDVFKNEQGQYYTYNADGQMINQDQLSVFSPGQK